MKCNEPPARKPHLTAALQPCSCFAVRLEPALGACLLRQAATVRAAARQAATVQAAAVLAAAGWAAAGWAASLCKHHVQPLIEASPVGSRSNLVLTPGQGLSD